MPAVAPAAAAAVARPPLVDAAMRVLKREHFQLLPDERRAVWQWVERVEAENALLRATHTPSQP